jgi:septum formation protein
VSQSSPLYLASASPRRQELLSQLELPFELVEAPVDEDVLAAAFTGPMAHLAEHLARSKAAAALERLRELTDQSVLALAGDTTVLLDGAVLGKPRDAARATAMLQALRGRSHDVVTALAVAEGDDGVAPVAIRSLTVRTHVSMREYTDAEIARYIATSDPFDKAGAYAIQHDGFAPVRSITGCYTGVVGLPLCAAAALLEVRAPATPAPASGCPWSGNCRAPFPTFAE